MSWLAMIAWFLMIAGVACLAIAAWFIFSMRRD